jgi:hypothetical protein
MIGWFVYLNNITTIVSSYDEWLNVIKSYNEYIGDTKVAAISKQNGRKGYPVILINPRDYYQQFDNVARGEGWTSMARPSSIYNSLITNDTTAIAQCFNIPICPV